MTIVNKSDNLYCDKSVYIQPGGDAERRSVPLQRTQRPDVDMYVCPSLVLSVTLV